MENLSEPASQSLESNLSSNFRSCRQSFIGNNKNLFKEVTDSVEQILTEKIKLE